MNEIKKETPTVSAADVEAAVSAAANASSLPTAEVISKQPMTQFHQGFYWCNVCTSGMNNESALDMHLAGRKHKAKLTRVDAALFTPHVPLGPLPNQSGTKKKGKGPTPAPPKTPLPPALFKCEACECEFNNEIPYQAHMAGKKHLKRMNAPAINAENSRFSCALCQFVGSSPTHLEAHLQGKAHAKKAGLPPPPPGPPAAPPAEKKPKPKRFNPYFKHRDRQNSSPHTGYYQTTRVPQVKSVSDAPAVRSANPAAYTTGIVGNYGFSLYDK